MSDAQVRHHSSWNSQSARTGRASAHLSVASSALTGAVLNCVADAVFTVDEQMRITSFNSAAEQITGFTREEVLGRPCHEVMRSTLCSSCCPVREARRSGRPIVNRDVEIRNKDNKRVPISLNASVLKDAAGHAIGVVEAFRTRCEQAPQHAAPYTFRNLVSCNRLMRRLFDALPDVARSDATVLVSGESGTGKELVVKAIHELSHRSAGPFVTVNCGAVPEKQLEAELFGTRRGPDGDGADRPGRLELARGGTLFLDEIGELPLSQQVKLMRVIETQEYLPLGSDAPQKIDVRFIAATNCDLSARVSAGTFRRDLFFRINVLALHIPPLRQRPEDVPLLIDLFLERLNRTYAKQIRGISSGALQVLLDYDYPGNVRELLNIMEQTVIFCRSDEMDLEHLPAALVPRSAPTHPAARSRRKEISADALSDLLNRHGGNRTEVAGVLGVDRTTLWRWMKRHELA